MAGQSVMIVEDDTDTLELYAMAIEGSGLRVIACPSADLALRKLEEGVLPDLILCDLKLSGTEGDKFVATLRAQPRWSQVRTALVSGADSLKERAVAARADAYLKKPFELEELESFVKKLLV